MQINAILLYPVLFEIGRSPTIYERECNYVSYKT